MRIRKGRVSLLVGTIILLVMMMRCACSSTSKGSEPTVAPAPVVTDEMSNGMFFDSCGNRVKHRIYGVYSYKDVFGDMQDTQMVAAMANGIPCPIETRAEAEQLPDELVFVGESPYYDIDRRMTKSIPYLVPKANVLLNDISRNFFDSLVIKNLPLQKLVVTSVLRTNEDVSNLQRVNGNASGNSCHRYGTTFDISYNHYHAIPNSDGRDGREVRTDTLKWILSEVLRDLRANERCFVKHEVKQGCFHITVR